MKKQLSFLFTWLLTLACVAQVPHFTHYGLLRKREAVQVNSIFQDRAGFIWHATNKGLFRFNGVSYRHYTLADSLPDLNVTALAQDADGVLWVGFGNGMLCRMINDKAVKFDAAEGAAGNEISDMLFDSKGNLWFSTHNDGLYYLSAGRLYRIDETDGLADLYIYDIAEDYNGNIWAGTDGGAACCSLVNGKLKVKMVGVSEGLPDHIIKKVKISDNGTVWMGTEDAGIVNYDPVSGKCLPLMRGKWPYGVVKDFLVHGSQVWIASRQHGLLTYHSGNGRVRLCNAEAGSDLGAVKVLMKDNEGNIWAGGKSGVLRTLGSRISHIAQFLPSRDANILSLSTDKLGNTWFSNNEGLFKRSTDALGQVTIQKQLQGTRFEKDLVISLYGDTMGAMWAGFYGQGLLRIGPDGSVKHFDKELRNGNVLHITGKGDQIWLATLGGGTRIIQGNGKFGIRNFDQHDGLSLDYIYQVFIDSRDRVWFATDGKGVDMLQNEKFTHFRAGLRSQVVYSITEDAKGEIWVNTQGDGLFRLHQGTFSHFTLSPGLRDENINCLTSDPQGNIVLMHDAGIELYDVKRNVLHSYGEESGIIGKVPNLNCVASGTDGTLMFGTEGGIVCYENEASYIYTSPRPLILGIRTPDGNVKDASAGLDLSYDENNIRIDFMGFWYQNPSALSFLYKLEGNDNDWIATKDLAATYSSLPPGGYTFRVKVSDNGSFRYAREASFGFMINPPFWRTSLFYSILVVFAMAFIYWFIRNRERSLMEANRKLEMKVSERTVEIQNKNEEIQAQYEEIQAQYEEIQEQADHIRHINDNLEELVMHRTVELERKNRALEEYAFINAHQLRSPVASILGLVDIMGTEESPEEQRVIISHLKQSTEKLDAIVDSITKAIERKD